MSRSRLKPIAIIIALASLPLADGALCGQEKPADAFPVAVLRLDEVFTSDKSFVEGLAAIKAEAEEVNRNVLLRQTELETAQAKLRQATPGSPEAERLKAQVGRLLADAQAFVGKERQRIMAKESKYYLAMYGKVEAVVKQYCQARGIKLVLRHQDLDENKEQSAQNVLNAINRGIIFEDGLDITDDIVKALADQASQNGNQPKP